MNEQEEFEFRLRLEQEQGQSRVPGLDTAMRLGRALMRSGPIGLAVEGTGMGWEGLEKAAEKGGDRVVDTLAPHVPAEAAAAVGTAVKMAPTVAGGFLGTGMGQPIKKGAELLMQSAMKPTSKSLANGDAAKAIDTMLREGVSVTAAGAARLREMITKLKNEVASRIATSPEMVNRQHVFQELSKTLDDVTKKGAGYPADRAAVLKAWDEFKNHPLLEKFAEEGDLISMQAADQVKRATQQSLKQAYRRAPTEVTPASEAAEKAIASGLRKGQEAADPVIAAKNAKMSEYINALHQLEPRAAIAANRDLAGIAPLAESPEMAMAMLADRNPWLKSFVAKVLYDARRAVPAGVTGTAAEVHRTSGGP